jgi:glycosyltransferase involved in cell wall biosynthesis
VKLVNARSDQPRFSVVIPVFNGERYVGEAIQSVLVQDYSPFEIIVVDDGSTDRTAEVVMKLSGPAPIIYHFQQNRGLAVTRNIAVSLSRGEWIALLDADDVWYPNKLALQATHLTAHPEVGLTWCDVDYIDADGNLRHAPTWRDPMRRLLFDQSVRPVPSSMVVRKDIFREIGGFNPRLRCYEDTEFFARVSAESQISFIPQKLAQYRYYEDQLHKNIRLRMENWPILFCSLWDLWRNDSSKRAALVEVSAAVNASIGKHFLRAGDYSRARDYFRQSFSQNPLFWTNLRRWGLSYLPGIRNIYRRAKKHAVRV